MNAICSRRDNKAEKSSEPNSYSRVCAGERALLRKGEVRVLHQRDRVAGIAVMSGAVWLTETPADRDIVLRLNERFSFAGKWPVVIEALEDSIVFQTSK